jgi:hypothetical protein
MPKNTKNQTETHADAEDPSNMIPDLGIEMEGMSDENIALPPYWKADEEALEQGIPQGFYASLVGYDDRDPHFPRYVLRNESSKPLACKRGPADEADDVSVGKGEHFTCSVYEGLPLGDYAHLPVAVYVKDKVKTSKAGQTVWIWGMKVTPEVRKILDARKAEAAKDPQAIGHIPGHREIVNKAKEVKALSAARA